MHRFKIIAFTHKSVEVNELAKFHFEEGLMTQKLNELKVKFELDGLMLISTCNRIEFLISTHHELSPLFLRSFFETYLGEAHWAWAMEHAQTFSDEEAFKHIFEVASSIDSLVVGEREIITQVRNAYDKCNALGLTDDIIRIVIRKTIETAKEVYTNTGIATKPVSVVSLAYHRLRELNMKNDSRFIIIGSGITNTTFCKFLKKHGYKNFVVFNRTKANADKLASELNADSFLLSELANYKKGFDVIVTCTASPSAIITPEIYATLCQGDTAKKVIIDLAVPADFDKNIMASNSVQLIAVESLQEIAKQNIQERQKELSRCNVIIEKSLSDFRQMFKTRMLELAMSEVPRKVKEIRDTAMNSVFVKEIDQMDPHSKEVLNKIVAYLEKKYISVPMKMAREILIEGSVSK